MSSSSFAAPASAFHIMTKPIGPICNLDCKYCYYLEKEHLYPPRHSFRMEVEVLEQYVKQYIAAQSGPEIAFAWQGGEPTLLGLHFFEKVVELQQKYCPDGGKITNALQTNGTLLDERWCKLFRENDFLIGLSIDGPRELHDKYRVDKGGKPTFDQVFAAMKLMQAENVEFNTLTTVHRANSRQPLEVYRFLRDNGSKFMQFIPIVERVGVGGRDDGLLWLAPPPHLQDAEDDDYPMMPWSVKSRDYGDFLVVIFDEWVRNDVGNVHVQLFEVQLGIWMGLPASLCVFTETCGSALAMEHNGDLYSCDHYVYDDYKLGNIMDTPMEQLARSDRQKQFGLDKRDTLPQYCRDCDVKFACNGECPKHRFIKTPDGEPGLNYLCAGYKRFFRHIDPYMKSMAQLVHSRRPAAEIMPMVRQRDEQQR
ncbi:MAG: anaerobic sulfatase maturase, partial [Candidatus Poribacteria bacterium]|nr:anaerobic sulfatase maturase [Candidatus Poribacteria bacterium]